MKTALKFFVPGKPGAKGRPRFTRAGHTYTPEETAVYENLVKLSFRDAYPDHTPTDQPLTMSVVAYYPIPESWPKKKKMQALNDEIFPGKPDWDNVGKIISDALNQVAYVDDSQIFMCLISKHYGRTPGIDVVLTIGGSA